MYTAAWLVHIISGLGEIKLRGDCLESMLQIRKFTLHCSTAGAYNIGSEAEGRQRRRGG